MINLDGCSLGVQRQTSVRLGCRSSARLLGGIFGSTFCRELAGVEHAVFSKFARGYGLRVVFEGVRWRIRAFVAYRQSLVLFYQNEIRMGSALMDGAWLNIA